ncbi:hypothetical protein ACVWVY_003593 [Bradyrhizobium sp. URHC0002]
MNNRMAGPSGAVAKGKKPPLFLLVSELRAAAEFTAMIATLPALLTAPRGDGHPVLVIPGFLAGDLSTMPLRRYLSTLGYHVHPWSRQSAQSPCPDFPLNSDLGIVGMCISE